MTALYDLAVNLPLRGHVAARLRDALARAPVDARMLGYPAPGGDAPTLEAIAAWMRLHGGHTTLDARRLVLTLGARHALMLALRLCCRPGDVLLVERLTYHGFRAAADAWGVRLVAVDMDGDGLCPAALERAIVVHGARTLYVQPTLHNPTTVTQPLARRREIAGVAAAHGLTVIEGDVYSALVAGERPTPLASLLPDRCLHAGGIGKVLGPGLRIGWLLLPDDARRDAAVADIARESDGLPLLLPSVIAGWLMDGTADALLRDLRDALRERNAMARALLGYQLVTADALHAWLPRHDADRIVADSRAVGVAVTPADGGIRLSLAAEEAPARLETALRRVATVLAGRAT